MKKFKRIEVARVAEIAIGERKICRIAAFGKEIEIGVFNVGGEFFAYRNACPHAGAPVCVGPICGTTAPGDVGDFNLIRQGEIVRCPWHGWEFDLKTGEHLVDETTKLRAYWVETGDENLESFEVETWDETVFVLI